MATRRSRDSRAGARLKGGKAPRYPLRLMLNNESGVPNNEAAVSQQWRVANLQPVYFVTP